MLVPSYLSPQTKFRGEKWKPCIQSYLNSKLLQQPVQLSKASPAYLPHSRALLLNGPEPQPMPGSANVPQGDQLKEKTYAETMLCPTESSKMIYFAVIITPNLNSKNRVTSLFCRSETIGQSGIC